MMLAVSSCASVQPRQATINWIGTYTADQTRVRSAPKTLSGQVTSEPFTTLQKSGSDIEATLGTKFGLGFSFIAPLRSEFITYDVTWIYPGNGLTNPARNLTSRTDSYSFRMTADAPAMVTYAIGETWQMVPGIWEVEIRVDGRRVLRQAFNVSIH
jgi:hypothetical protein